MFGNLLFELLSKTLPPVGPQQFASGNSHEPAIHKSSRGSDHSRSLKRLQNTVILRIVLDKDFVLTASDARQVYRCYSNFFSRVGVVEDQRRYAV